MTRCVFFLYNKPNLPMGMNKVNQNLNMKSLQSMYKWTVELLRVNEWLSVYVSKC